MAFESVRRPHSTIESATKGIALLPLNVADVYPYVTLEIILIAARHFEKENGIIRDCELETQYSVYAPFNQPEKAYLTVGLRVV